MDKNTKILIPEIPGDWTARIRSGHLNIWNEALHGRPHSNGLPEVRMEPPERGLYAERIDDAWYWVCGCERCLGNGKSWSYITCYEHDRCITCHTHNTELPKDMTRWGKREGFRCGACQDHVNATRKADALAKAAASGHSESDCSYTDAILCPHCASEQSTDDRHEDEAEAECGVCGGLYSLELHYSVSYTTMVAGKAPA